MYNEKLKLEFMEDHANRNTTLKDKMDPLFAKTEVMEIELDKDVSCFTVSEIIDFFKRQLSASHGTLNNYNSQLKKYADYCIMRNLVPDNQNHFYEINDEILKDCVNVGLFSKKIITREEVLSILEEEVNPCYKFMILAHYEGIGVEKEDDDLIYLRMSDFENNKVKLHSGREIEVSDELIVLAKKASTCYEFYLNRKYGILTKDFDESDDRVMKFLPGENNDDFYARLNRKFVVMKRTLEIPALTRLSLKESGRISMIKHYMETDRLTYTEVLKKYEKEIAHQFGVINQPHRWVKIYEPLFNN